MGMLSFDKGSAERKESFISTWIISKEEGEEDPYTYRTHYSTSLYITYYLVRVFPFSNMRIELQGKNFDDPNRLFNSMKDSFMCASTQRADLRELIPELFYFPEMLYNLNNFNLGEIKDKVTNINWGNLIDFLNRCQFSHIVFLSFINTRTSMEHVFRISYPEHAEI